MRLDPRKTARGEARAVRRCGQEFANACETRPGCREGASFTHVVQERDVLAPCDASCHAATPPRAQWHLASAARSHRVDAGRDAAGEFVAIAP